jgi:apolipoprotein N-acyltransferase
MNRPDFRRMLPAWKNVLLTLLSAILLILAFPDFEFWWLAWFALVPLMWAAERQKESVVASAVLGWIFGFTFFFGTCWWLAYAPIHYAEFPAALAYFLVFCAAAGAAVFPAVFTGLLAYLLKRFGHSGILAAPAVWVLAEFLRYWLTGNNWNAIAYSQAVRAPFVSPAAIGGIYLVGFWVLAVNTVTYEFAASRAGRSYKNWYSPVLLSLSWTVLVFYPIYTFIFADSTAMKSSASQVVGIQPNVPMNGLDNLRWQRLRTRHVELTELALEKLPTDNRQPTTVIFPESPMNFMYDEDPEFRAFVSAFAAKNNVNVLFNSAEPDPENKRYYNSAVLVDTTGREIAQYDKIYLLPFGEAVPAPLQSIVPAFVGNFSYGKNYSLIPLGDAKAGVMICFESHFGQLSREYVRRGADVLIEMTNDGYLGPTPVLRQHLANAVFRAVETNRPVLRVTNVGITAYINERGEVLDATQPYTEDTRVWSVAKSDGSQTFYVKYGDWFAWLCTAVSVALIALAFIGKKRVSGIVDNG